MNIKPRVRAFITERFRLPKHAVLTDDASLIGQGIVDSIGLLEIIGFVERAFGLTVEHFEMVPENLDSITCISTFVEAKASVADTEPAPFSV